MMNRSTTIISISIALIMLTIITITSTAFAANLSVQTATNKYNYTSGKVVTVRANAQNGARRVRSASISSAKATIKNPAGMTMVGSVTMSKDPVTGLCYYNYTLPSNASKGTWTASVAIIDASGNSGSGVSAFKVQSSVFNHANAFTSYQGTKTCITSGCHLIQAQDMFNSIHYQWNGDPQKAIELNSAGSRASKLGGINNYCIWPDGNWLTLFNKLDTTKAPGGCGWCHAGLGLKPTASMSQSQLENIDCLMCHSPSYKRVVSQNVDGTYTMVPDPGIDIQAAAKNIIRPTKAECMRCHQNSGGGNNYKRGDIESTAINCTKSYDVHMGSDGQNFNCQDCHRTLNHKIAGRGTDMRALDSTFSMNCENCHTQVPHRSSNSKYNDLNKHTDKVDCTVCHIPSFAKTVATDMKRDWSAMETDTVKQLYDPILTKQTNVMPIYSWFNGFSHFYKFKDPVALDTRGIQKITWPDGGFTDTPDKLSKLYPYKVHEGVQPKNNVAGNMFDNILLPLKNKIAFETGNVNAAIQQGAAAAGITYNGHTFQKTEQYQSIYHVVGPKSTALSCSNRVCHSQISGVQTNRIPFKQLGYQVRGTTAQLCDTCHDQKSMPSFTSFHSRHSSKYGCVTCHGSGYALKETKNSLCDNCHKLETTSDINKIHSKHVKDKHLNCSSCHTFSNSLTNGGHSEDLN